MGRKAAGYESVGLLADEEAPIQTARKKPEGIFQKAGSYLSSLGFPTEVIREFNLFLGYYCKKRGKPSMEDVAEWARFLQRLVEWKYDWEDVCYVIRYPRTHDRYYLAIPPDMGQGGAYWFEKGQRLIEGGQKSKKVYV